MLLNVFKKENMKAMIPSSFSTCDSLEYVDFTDNQIEGGVPWSLSNCTHLN